MLVSSISSRLNRLVSTPLLRAGLTARYALAGDSVARDNIFLDSLLLLPVAQKLISIEAQEDAARETRRRLAAPREPSAFDRFVDRAWNRLFKGGYTDERGKEGSVAAEKPNDCVRLFHLESYLRPALVPNERWGDVLRWQHNRRFIRWARTEFLVAKYGKDLREALQRYPQLKVVPLQMRVEAKTSVRTIFRQGDDSSVDITKPLLPSSRTLSKAFDMKNWARKKNPDAGWDRMQEIAEGLGGEVIRIPQSDVRVPLVPPETDVSSLSLEDLLEIAGGHVSHSGPFNLLCEEGDIYEFWTKEYVVGLASYLLDRVEAYDGETIVLDVGAGDGMLVHFLKDCVKMEAHRRLHEKESMGQITRGRRKGRKSIRRRSTSLNIPTLLATDDGSWKIEAKSPVELISCKDALAKYSKPNRQGGDEKRRQLIVICSWMPMGEDWTKDMRSGGADEYILIGECDDGTCGENWKTWGNSDFFDMEVQENGHTAEGFSLGSKLLPPYQAEGFDRVDLDDLSLFNFSRFDSSVSSNSKTVSFRRR